MMAIGGGKRISPLSIDELLVADNADNNEVQ